MADFEQVRQSVLAFRDERDWLQFHNPKDLAISLSLEAAELLETFQWSGEDLWRTEKAAEQKAELADVLIYALLLADRLGIDPLEAIATKLEENNRKYPADKSRGKSDSIPSCRGWDDQRESCLVRMYSKTMPRPILA